MKNHHVTAAKTTASRSRRTTSGKCTSRISMFLGHFDSLCGRPWQAILFFVSPGSKGLQKVARITSLDTSLVVAGKRSQALVASEGDKRASFQRVLFSFGSCAPLDPYVVFVPAHFNGLIVEISAGVWAREGMEYSGNMVWKQPPAPRAKITRCMFERARLSPLDLCTNFWNTPKGPGYPGQIPDISRWINVNVPHPSWSIGIVVPSARRHVLRSGQARVCQWSCTVIPWPMNDRPFKPYGLGSHRLPPEVR